MGEPKTIFERFSRAREDSQERVNLEAFEQEKNILIRNRENFHQLASRTPAFSDVPRREGVFEAVRLETPSVSVDSFLVSYNPATESYGYFLPKSNTGSNVAAFDRANAAISSARMEFVSPTKTPALSGGKYIFDGTNDEMRANLGAASYPTTGYTYGMLLEDFDESESASTVLLMSDSGEDDLVRFYYNASYLMVETYEGNVKIHEVELTKPTAEPIAFSIGFEDGKAKFYLNSLTPVASVSFTATFTSTPYIRLMGAGLGSNTLAGTFREFVIQNDAPSVAMPKLFYHWKNTYGLEVTL